MNRDVDDRALEEADRLINDPLPFAAELPDVSELDRMLHLLEGDEAYSIRHRPPPPLSTEVGNEQVRAYYQLHPQHPMADDDRARNRRRAAFLILNCAARQSSAFTPQRMESLHRCVFDCDASVRHDLVKAIAKIGSSASAAVVQELARIEPESDMVLAMATLMCKRLGAKGAEQRHAADGATHRR